MKRKADWDEEEESDYEGTNASENDESDNEEPRIKDVLEGLSQLVSRQKASDLLHSMAASKDILFWTPSKQLLRNQRIIPVTNISELVEYVLLPHNDDIVKPHALKTFKDGLAELGINKRLIQNKRILAELLEKEQAYHDKDSEAGDQEMVSESSDMEDDTETASEISDQESQNPDLEPEGNSDEEETASSEILLKVKGPCYYCNGENVYERAVVKCPRCFWQDGYRICPICAHQIPVDRKHLADGFIWCADCHAVKHIDSKTLKRTHYPPSEDEDD